ncbi:hypothetical protein, partial [Sphingobium yanoikuyae]|uniref:hypothetical protein n=1 Tax=Sphingobium yanoikuyae TaxID=13690 RepID=UPI00345E0A9D
MTAITLFQPSTSKLLAAIEDGALRMDEDVQRIEGGGRCGDRGGIADIDLGIADAVQIRSFLAGIIGGAGTRAPDMDVGATLQEGLGHAICR